MKKLDAPWLRAMALAGLAFGGLGLAACGGGNSGGSGPPPTVSTTPVGPAPEAVPIRRLTNDEYVMSMGDLFPGFSLPELSFVADAKVLGFTNLTSSQTGSLVWAEQHEAAAEAVARLVAADPTTLTGCDATTRGELICAQPYLYDLAKRAYRRPLASDEKDALTGLLQLNQDSVDYPTRLWLSIEGVLLSPKFLFRPELGDSTHLLAQGLPLTNWEVATRLSYLINGSIPDAALTASADSGKLATAAELKAQTQRLLAMPRSQDHLARFHEQWLGVDTISALTKNPINFPKFSALLASEMGKETRLFLKDVMFTQQGTFADLFLSNHTFADAGLATFYGVPAPANDWDRVDLDPSQRAGILTQASLMATLAKDTQTDPVRRGKFVLNQILCQSISPPSPQVMALFKPMNLALTARDQFAQHRVDPVCMTCHDTIDPLGLPFEHYDGMGQWRDTDRGMALDVTGAIEGTAFDGIPQMAKLVVDNPETRGCYVSQWFRFNAGRLNGDSDQPYLDWLSSSFGRDTKLVDLVVSMIQSDSFRYLKLDPTVGSAP
jgi:Protein of unknown function (DUF1592)/Protein of unknown function (DUF1588)/Protein of unknown function (DUF1595)/Protein of unknown function (DUF1587)/Protein of unknown function (DUF1585)